MNSLKICVMVKSMYCFMTKMKTYVLVTVYLCVAQRTKKKNLNVR